MKSALAAISTPALLVLLACILYVPRLADAPLYISHDEAVYSLQAHAIATTGYDLNGRFLPMYIEYPPRFGRPTWNQPLLIYAIAATLKVLPFSETAIRLPMVVAAILDLVLIYFVARLIFASEFLAVTAAVLLATTPAHFMHSRTAIDFQLSVPFVLGWLLALVLYFQRARAHLLFIAGLVLGVSVYGYVAAYVVTPILAVCTGIALVARREPVRRYGVLLAGVVVPTLVCLPWMLQNPLPFRDIFAHYAVLEGGGTPNRTGFVGLITGFATSPRLTEIPALYASFWEPRFLFVDGPLRFRSIQQTGVFLLALAGAGVGVIRALSRRSSTDWLLLAGLITAPMPASLAGEAQAIWRALQMTPFVVLLAIAVFDRLPAGAAVSTLGRTALLITFPIVCALAIRYHDVVPFATATVRVAVVPMVVIGFAGLLRHVDWNRLPPLHIAVISVATIVVTHGIHVVMHQALPTGIAVLVGVCALAFVPRAAEWLGHMPRVVIAIVALAVAHLLYLYVDYEGVPRVAGLPVSAVLLAIRLSVSAIVCGAVFAVSRALARASAHLPILAAAGAMIALQLAYFWVDYFADPSRRAVYVAVVLASALALSWLVRDDVRGDRTIGRLILAAVFGLGAIQFTHFLSDYYGDFRARNVDSEGNVRFAMETAIERARDRTVPAVYLGKTGPYGAAPLYWQFYLVKHQREDLLAHTIPALEFNRERIRGLPAGSLVINIPWKDTDAVIAEMMAAGEVRPTEMLKGRDGSPGFWVLETTGR